MSEWEGRRVLVAGFGISGFAAADALVHLGAAVTVIDDGDPEPHAEEAKLLTILGADVRLGPGSSDTAPMDVDLVVTSPGWSPSNPVLRAATDNEIPVIGDVELAWRLRGPDAAPWIGVTGTNGKTTTVEMLAAIFNQAGLKARAVGNVGVPIVQAIMDPEPVDVFVVELSSFQLHWADSLALESAAVLNVADDHSDWHGGAESYAAAKGKIFHQVEKACVYNVADELTRQLVEDAEVVEGARAIGFTLAIPAPGQVGVVDGTLVDRAFVPNRQVAAAELCAVSDLASDAPHFVANALAAAALARAHGVEPVAIRDALGSYVPGGHRIAVVAQIDSVTYVDDSKATNPHAVAAAVGSVPGKAVWIAGGLAKGAHFDELVEKIEPTLRAAVLIGRDAPVIAEALERHAPHVRTVRVEPGETDLMDEVVGVAASLAEPGDTVLLAPGCASQDQFADYAQRGDAFAAAVTRFAENQ